MKWLDRILTSAAQELAQFASAVYRQLFREEERVVVAPVGGVFRSELLRERFRTMLEVEQTGCE